MGSSVPTGPRADVLAWCQAHTDIFATNAVAIGLTSQQAVDFETLTGDYAAAFGEVEKARIALRLAVDNADNAYTLMRRSMTQAVSDIRYFALQQNDPQTVYNLAQVPPRADPSSLPPPGRPTDFSVELLDATGALQLRWKCINPRGTSGTSYIVRRKLPGETVFSFVGVTGERRFVDNTFTAGPDSVEYTVQAQRADRAGLMSAVFQINFGLQGPGRSAVTGTRQAA
jgi:hypothetical protein